MGDPKTDEQDPGAFVGQEPERKAEPIPGGVKPGDERVAAHDAAPGVAGEPDAEPQKSEFDRFREAGKAVTGRQQDEPDDATQSELPEDLEELGISPGPMPEDANENERQ